MNTSKGNSDLSSETNNFLRNPIAEDRNCVKVEDVCEHVPPHSYEEIVLTTGGIEIYVLAHLIS